MEARIEKIIAILKVSYPSPKIALQYRNPFELLVATILSSQCTDAVVNRVTPALFKKFPTPRAMAQASIIELEALIRSTGFYHNKAKNLKTMAQMLEEKYYGQVPQTPEALLPLPGVARKTANVVLGTAFGLASGVVVDTHMKRLAVRLGLTREKTPEKIEKKLMNLLPQKEWILFSLRLILHGREICFARKPACSRCPLNTVCPSAFKITK